VIEIQQLPKIERIMKRNKSTQSTRFIFCTLAIVLIAMNNLFAQPAVPAPLAPGKIPDAPSMASLGVYGQIPVGFFTGVPDISVPLYTVKYKDLFIPIVINYHNAVGNKADAMPGSLGAGWAMFAGGSISRVSKELTGEEVMSATGAPLPVYVAPTSDPDWSTTPFLQSFLTNNTHIYSDEAQYDAFYFNFGGNSGYIYFDHLGNPRIKSSTSNQFKIEAEIKSSQSFTFPVIPQTPSVSNVRGFSNFLYKFTLTDNFGTVYTFGGTNNSIEFSRLGHDPGASLMISSAIIATTWQLTSIKSANGYQIDLDYRRGDIIVTQSTHSAAKVVYKQYPYGSASNWQTDNLPYDRAVFSTLVNPVYLSSITTPNEHVDFFGSIADDQLGYDLTGFTSGSNKIKFNYYTDIANGSVIDRFPDKLDQVIVYDKDDVQQKKINFSYTNSNTTRLKLLGLAISGKTSTDSDPITYAFEYNSQSLPAYLSYKTDGYGYYNNKVDTEPFANLAHSSNFTNYYPTREPDIDYATAEIISKVTYPTKGYTTFEFELNEYGATVLRNPFSTPTNSNTSTGGLRIKKISSYSAASVLASEKTYLYVKNYASSGTASSGVLSYKPIYYEDITGSPLTAPAQYASSGVSFSGDVRVRRWNSEGLYPMSNTQGSHITYSEVVEKNYDNSFTVYKYNNYDNGYNNIPALNAVIDNSGLSNFDFTANDLGSSMDLERGQMNEQQVYSSAGTLKQKTTFLYNNDPTRLDDYIRVIKKATNSIYSEKSLLPSIRFTASQVFVYYPYLKKKEVTTYFGTGNTVNTEEYAYDINYRLLKEQKTFDSRGIENKVTYDYPSDMVASSVFTPYQDMVTNNLNGNVIITKMYTNSVQKAEIFKKFKNWTTPNSPILPEYIETKVGSTVRDKTIFNGYDIEGNLLSFNQNNGPTQTLVWSYKRQFPVGKIVGSDYSTIESALGGSSAISTFSNSLPSDYDVETFLQPLNASVPNAHFSINTYHPLRGVTSTIDDKGMKTSYAFDGFNRLWYIKDQDGNVIKSFCYNYAGQSVNCSDMVPLPPELYQPLVHYATTSSEICNYGSEFSPPLTVFQIFYYSGGFVAIIALPVPLPALIYTDSSLTTVAPDGYYSFLETEPGHIGYKVYHVVGGVVVAIIWCGE
jgi:hypothetical protein